jgi:hypothetical protein
MDINLRHAAITLAAVVGISFFAGYKVAPREILDSTVEHVGFLTMDTKKVLSATIESLKSESRLVSYSYVGNQNVLIDKSYWYLFNGRQQLIVPATITYFVDLAKLNDSSATFDESTNTVTVMMPKLMLTVEFDPRRATTINSGMLMLNDDLVQVLTKLNYDTARKSAIKQGQQAELVKLAKESAKENIERLFKIPLQLTGMGSSKVVVSFQN